MENKLNLKGELKKELERILKKGIDNDVHYDGVLFNIASQAFDLPPYKRTGKELRVVVSLREKAFFVSVLGGNLPTDKLRDLGVKWRWTTREWGKVFPFAPTTPEDLLKALREAVSFAIKIKRIL